MIERFGTHALMQWLLLLIYSKSGTKAIDEKNSHAVFAQNRIDVMVALLERISPEVSERQREQIHLIAMFSLLEGLMNVPLEAMLQSLHTSEEIEDALLSHTGVLGRVYAAALKIESGDVNSAAVLLKSYGITHEMISALRP
jgi:c-di-GMP phosphodiesterase